MREYTLDEIRDLAQSRLERLGRRVDAAAVMRVTRSLLTRVRLTEADYHRALSEGVLTRDQVRCKVAPWTQSAEHKAIEMLRELRAAGLLWCDERRAFVRMADAVDHVGPADREGKPYPAPLPFDAIRAAHAALGRGKTVEKPDSRVPDGPQGFASTSDMLGEMF